MRAQQAVARRVQLRQLMLPCMYKYTPGEEMAVRSCTKKKKKRRNELPVLKQEKALRDLRKHYAYFTLCNINK